MSIEKRTELNREVQSRLSEYEMTRRPVVALAANYPDRHRIPEHAHGRAQLIYAVTGVISATTAVGTWVLPSLRALWMPAGTKHRLRMHGACAVRTLYILPCAVPHLPTACGVVNVPPLLRELILEAVRLPREYRRDGRDGRIMRLLLEEIRVTPLPSLHLPLPKEPRVARVCAAIMKQPADARSLEDWAGTLFTSSKTLARLFVRETGISFGRWRQQARLMASLPRLAHQEAVMSVAFDLGYTGPSAFTTMFRKAMGVTPSQYFQRTNFPDNDPTSERGRPARC